MKYINKTRFFALFLTFTLLFTLALSYAKTVGSDISKSVVRLHIIANSNSNADQSLKLKVRDRILKDASHIFNDTDNSGIALNLAKDNSAFIKSLAEDEIRRLGFEYPVSINIGEYPFPTKVYGDIALPAGKYNAVRIEIGDAKGENWWCVMYPPLCFAEGVLSASKDAKAQLKNSLSSEEYQLISENSPSVEVRFKIVELFQQWF